MSLQGVEAAIEWGLIGQVGPTDLKKRNVHRIVFQGGPVEVKLELTNRGTGQWPPGNGIEQVDGPP